MPSIEVITPDPSTTTSMISLPAVPDTASGAAVDRVNAVAHGVLDRVVAGAAVDRIIAAAAGEDVVAAVAGDDVGELVTGAVDVAAARQHQVLDIGLQVMAVADRRPYGVSALVGEFCDVITVVDVGVVAAQT